MLRLLSLEGVLRCNPNTQAGESATKHALPKSDTLTLCFRPLPSWWLLVNSAAGHTHVKQNGYAHSAGRYTDRRVQKYVLFCFHPSSAAMLEDPVKLYG